MDEEDMIEEPSKMSHADLVRIQEMFAGDSKFKSKRQQELEKLVKQPVITQILIKFKLWNEDEILAIFSPQETHSSLFEVAHKEVAKVHGQDIANNMYLYTAPPLRRLGDATNNKKTLEEFNFAYKAIVRVNYE